jgi:hypothetical protein
LIIIEYYLNTFAQLLYGPKFEFQQESGIWKRKDQYGDFRPEEIPTTIKRDLEVGALNGDTFHF